MRPRAFAALLIILTFLVLPGYRVSPAYGESSSGEVAPAPEISDTEKAAAALAQAILAPQAKAPAKPAEPGGGSSDEGGDGDGSGDLFGGEMPDVDMDFIEAMAQSQLDMMKQMLGGQVPPELQKLMEQAQTKVDEIAPPEDSAPSDPLAADAVKAVMEVLARAGIATGSRSGLIQEAVAPTLPIKALDTEVYALAEEARGTKVFGARLTLGELGQMLQQVGWDVPVWIEPGQALADALALMVKEAQANPELPHSFVPLFLQEMAKQRSPSVDLTGKVNPNWVPISTLEAQLLLAHHARGNESYALEVATGLSRWLSPNVAHAATPCSDMMDGLGDFKPFASYGLDKLGGIPADAIYDKLGIPMVKLSHIGIALKLVKMVGMMVTDLVKFTVVAEDKVHYSHDPENLHDFGFEAVVLLDIDKLKSPVGEFGTVVADCMATMGYNMPNTYDSLMKAAKDWKVFWYVDGLKEHATVNEKRSKFDFRVPTVGSKVKQAADRFIAWIAVDMAPEEAPCNVGPLGKSEMRMKAELDTSQAVDPATLLKVIQPDMAGVPEALADVLAEWFKKWTPQKASSTVNVEWHKTEHWTGTITYKRHYEQSSSETRKTSDGAYSTHMSNTADYEATINIDTDRRCGGNEKVTATASFRNDGNEKGSGKSLCFTAEKNQASERNWSSTGTWSSTGSGTKSDPAGAFVAWDISPVGEYSLTFTAPSVKAKSTSTFSAQRSGGCPGSEDSSSDSTNFTETIQGASISLSGPIDPDAMELSGSKSWKEGDYTKITVTWNLSGKAEK